MCTNKFVCVSHCSVKRAESVVALCVREKRSNSVDSIFGLIWSMYLLRQAEVGQNCKENLEKKKHLCFLFVFVL